MIAPVVGNPDVVVEDGDTFGVVKESGLLLAARSTVGNAVTGVCINCRDSGNTRARFIQFGFWDIENDAVFILTDNPERTILTIEGDSGWFIGGMDQFFVWLWVAGGKASFWEANDLIIVIARDPQIGFIIELHRNYAIEFWAIDRFFKGDSGVDWSQSRKVYKIVYSDKVALSIISVTCNVELPMILDNTIRITAGSQQRIGSRSRRDLSDCNFPTDIIWNYEVFG